MNKPLTAIPTLTAFKTASKELLTEVLRKSIHLLIGLTPVLVDGFGRTETMVLLVFGISVYIAAEYLRVHGVKVPIISTITKLAMRERDKKGFVLGPVTLGFGALLALMLYPEPASIIALYALAFGDGLSSLAGKLFGTIKIPFTGGKSVEGSFAGFLGVYVAVTVSFPQLSPIQVLSIALVAMVLEALPTRDYDNIVIPLGTGLFAYLIL